MTPGDRMPVHIEIALHRCSHETASRLTRSYTRSSTRRISESTASVRLGLSMRTPNSTLPCSALHEKFALVTKRNRWSMARNLAWLREYSGSHKSYCSALLRQWSTSV